MQPANAKIAFEDPAQDEDAPPPYYEATPLEISGVHGYEASSLSTECYNYAVLSLAGTNIVRLFRFPETVTSSIRQVVSDTWPKGIQYVSDSDDNFEVRLRGNPFGRVCRDDKIAARKLVMNILQALEREGWAERGQRRGIVGCNGPEKQGKKVLCSLSPFVARGSLLRLARDQFRNLTKSQVF